MLPGGARPSDQPAHKPEGAGEAFFIGKIMEDEYDPAPTSDEDLEQAYQEKYG